MGDVRTVDWTRYKNQVDVVHGGPPCQPFSMAGRQGGHLDSRDMWPEFIRAVLEVEPAAFVAENVPALMQQKFAGYVDQMIREPLSSKYAVKRFMLHASSFGVPQVRKRVFFVGFKDEGPAAKFRVPEHTHSDVHLRPGRVDDAQVSLELPGPPYDREPCMGVRQALGLPDIGIDRLAPTIRCSWTGPRGTTSILSSVSAKRIWSDLKVWPNGVAADREAARRFVAKNGDFRLSVGDCGIIQGFPEDWKFNGPVYVQLGQIGNAVPPPFAYQVALAVAQALD